MLQVFISLFDLLLIELEDFPKLVQEVGMFVLCERIIRRRRHVCCFSTLHFLDIIRVLPMHPFRSVASELQFSNMPCKMIVNKRLSK